jgi:hypothetical protein
MALVIGGISTAFYLWRRDLVSNIFGHLINLEKPDEFNNSEIPFIESNMPGAHSSRESGVGAELPAMERWTGERQRSSIGRTCRPSFGLNRANCGESESLLRSRD